MHSPSFETLIRLAEALETSVDYLLTGDEAEEVPIHSQCLLERFRALEGLEAEDRETVIELIDAMIVKRKVESVAQAGR